VEADLRRSEALGRSALSRTPYLAQWGRSEALGLDIVVRISGICKGFASGTAKPIRKGQSSLFCVSAGSSPVPHVGVKGTPSLIVRIRPSSHPPAIHLAGPEK